MADDGATQNALEAVRLLIEHARQVVLPNLRADGDLDERAIKGGPVRRSLTCVEAAVRLAEGGFGREVMILNRALFELMVDARWAHAHSDLAGERFVEYARLTQHLQREQATRYPEMFGEPIEHQERLSDEELGALRATFGKYGEKGWTGQGLPERLKSIEHLYDEETGDRRELWIAYDVLNRLSNAELHPSSWSLGRALRQVPRAGGGHRLQLRTEPEEELVPGGLMPTWAFFGDLIGLTVEEFGLAIEPVMEVRDAGARLLGERPES